MEGSWCGDVLWISSVGRELGLIPLGSVVVKDEERKLFCAPEQQQK